MSGMPVRSGGKDLGGVAITGDEKGIIENCRDQINTEVDEMFPTIYHDGT